MSKKDVTGGSVIPPKKKKEIEDILNNRNHLKLTEKDLPSMATCIYLLNNELRST